MAQELKLEAKGLYTNPSDLQRPEGSLCVADNIVIKRDGIIEPRKGFRRWALNDSDLLNLPYTKVVPYKGGLVFFIFDSNSNTSMVAYTSGNMSDNTGVILEESTSPSAIAFKYVGNRWDIANGNLYMPTNIATYKKTSLNSVSLIAGAAQGPGMDRDDRVYTSNAGGMSLTSNIVTVNTTSAHGFYAGMVVSQTSATEAPYAKGSYTIISTPSGTQFTYALTAADDAANANAHTFQPTQLEGTNGWLSDGYQVAYRYILNIPDANQVENVSASSPRCVIANSSAFVGYVSGAKTNPIVRLILPKEVPSTLQSNVVIRVYRSKSVETTIEPSDEMGLVAERTITKAEWSRRYVDILDITPDALRGEALYTSPSQEGILQNNEIPPIMASATENASAIVFDGVRMLYGGYTSKQHQIVVNLLAVGGTNGLQNNQLVKFGNANNSVVVTGVTGTPTTSSQFKIDTSGTDSQNIRNTALNMCSAINRQHGHVYAYYISSATDAPGKILVKVNISATDKTEIYAETNNKRDCFFPSFGAYYKAFSLTRSGSTVTATTTSGTHNFRVGDDVMVDLPSSNFGAGPFTVLTATSTTLTYAETGSVATETHYLQTANSPKSSNDTQYARVYESKPNIPEAVPPLSFADVGDSTKKLWALAVVRNQVFAFKDDGLFIRVAPQTWELFDATVRLVSTRSVVTLLNNVYAWTTQGIVAINDTGVEIISRPIEKTLNDAFSDYPNECRDMAFGIANELDRTYSIAVPNATSPEKPANLYTFNTITRTWTRENISNQTFLDATTVSDTNQKAYRVLLSTSDLLVERRNNNKSDFHDVSGTAYTPNSKTVSTLVYNSPPGFAAGDMLVSDSGAITLVTSVAGTTYNVSPNISTSDLTWAKCGAINSNWKYNPVTAENADVLKLWRQANVLFQNCHVDEMSAEFSTELITTAQSQTVDMETLAAQWSGSWDGVERPYNLSLLIPQDVRRGTRLNVKLTLNKACQVFAVNGLGLRFSPSGDKVSK